MKSRTDRHAALSLVGVVAVVASVGSVFVLAGNRLRQDSDTHALVWIASILGTVIGWLIIGLLGDGLLRAVGTFTLQHYRRIVPYRIQARLGRRIGGPGLLFVVMLGIVAIVACLFSLID